MKDKIGEKIIAQKINQLEAGDESIHMDTNELWNKLERSLDEKTTKKIRLYRYWPVAAAAVLLIALFIATLLPKPGAHKDIPMAASKSVRPDMAVPVQSGPEVKTQEPGKVAVREHKKTRLAVTGVIGELALIGIEDTSQPGMYTAPAIDEVGYNTTIEDELACY